MNCEKKNCCSETLREMSDKVKTLEEENKKLIEILQEFRKDNCNELSPINVD